MALNRARVVGNVAISSNLYFMVAVEYFDSADAATVLWAEAFSLPLGSTTAQLQAKVVERGQEVRVGLAALAAARVAVPAGTTITVP